MRIRSRAAVAALSTITAATGVLLPLAGPALASATPPAASASLAGTWANTNGGTRSLANIVITRRGPGILVDGFGACSPTSCEWGNVAGTVFGPNVSATTGSSFQASWNFGFAREVLLATLTHPAGAVPTLVVKEFTTFNAGDGRSNYTVTEKFVRSRRAIKPTTSGKISTTYPKGDWVKPVKALLGTWKNTSATGGTIARIVLTLKPDGSLRVHAFGKCTPTLCNWGLAQGITFGTGISSTSGRAFLAPYRFSFKKVLLSGSVGPAGRILTVQSNSEFTDHSGRSNYVVTDTFRRA